MEGVLRGEWGSKRDLTNASSGGGAIYTPAFHFHPIWAFLAIKFSPSTPKLQLQCKGFCHSCSRFHKYWHLTFATTKLDLLVFLGGQNSLSSSLNNFLLNLYPCQNIIRVFVQQQKSDQMKKGWWISLPTCEPLVQNTSLLLAGNLLDQDRKVQQACNQVPKYDQPSDWPE